LTGEGQAIRIIWVQAKYPRAREQWCLLKGLRWKNAKCTASQS
jgi:hypothetical protein